MLPAPAQVSDTWQLSLSTSLSPIRALSLPGPDAAGFERVQRGTPIPGTVC